MLYPDPQTSSSSPCSVSWLCSLLCWHHSQAECPHGMAGMVLRNPRLTSYPSQHHRREHLSPTDVMEVFTVSWLEGPRSHPWTWSGEMGSFLFELLGERRQGGSEGEAEQTENPNMFIGILTQRPWRSSELQVSSLKPFHSPGHASSLPCITSQHLYCCDTHLPIDKMTLVIPSVSCIGNLKTFKAVPKILDLMYFVIFFLKPLVMQLKKKLKIMELHLC